MVHTSVTLLLNQMQSRRPNRKRSRKLVQSLRKREDMEATARMANTANMANMVGEYQPLDSWINGDFIKSFGLIEV